MADVSLAELRELLMARAGATFVEVVTDTQPKMNRTGNPFWGRVRRIARRNGMIGTLYAKDVNNQRVREGQPLDAAGNVEEFTAEQLWNGHGEYVNPSVARHTVKGSEYLVLFPTRRTPEGLPIVDEDQWLLDGVPVEKAVVEPHLVPPSVSQRQQVTKKIPWRTILMGNVKQIKLDGELHTVNA